MSITNKNAFTLPNTRSGTNRTYYHTIVVVRICFGLHRSGFKSCVDGFIIICLNLYSSKFRKEKIIEKSTCFSGVVFH